MEIEKVCGLKVTDAKAQSISDWFKIKGQWNVFERIAKEDLDLASPGHRLLARVNI